MQQDAKIQYTIHLITYCHKKRIRFCTLKYGLSPHLGAHYLKRIVNLLLKVKMYYYTAINGKSLIYSKCTSYLILIAPFCLGI
jgi:hypothetical protein